MSSPRKAGTEPGKDQQADDSNTKDLNSWENLPSSSQGKTPRSVAHEVFANEVNSEEVKSAFQDFQHSDYEDLFKETTEGKNEHSMRTAGGSFLRDKRSSEREGLAGPSQSVSARLPVQHQEYSGPNERTTSWHGSNKGAVLLLL
ncbi:protein tyrosine phosphatase non-receptor type 20 [Rhinolophus ferrumequinum]|uniref:Protein tyrosine phosphatase non-receptor type 20 n=1 Tax=Rhinolophus ferrumequinum TaxID=59479 RepID=A0A7J7UXX3_RHIFE|nr:protein tyrosine phosphatase non-receptor type 20 [Rhinolophus ferrumequinum]